MKKSALKVLWICILACQFKYLLFCFSLQGLR